MAASRYRMFLRLCEEWPVDNSKYGRDFGTFLRQCVANTFKRGDLTIVNEKDCDEKYDALQKLNCNYYKELHSNVVFQALGSTGSLGLTYEQCNALSGTDALKESMAEKPGMFSVVKQKLGWKYQASE